MGPITATIFGRKAEIAAGPGDGTLRGQERKKASSMGGVLRQDIIATGEPNAGGPGQSVNFFFAVARFPRRRGYGEQPRVVWSPRHL